jgi:hypothetical protein
LLDDLESKESDRPIRSLEAVMGLDGDDFAVSMIADEDELPRKVSLVGVLCSRSDRGCCCCESKVLLLLRSSLMTLLQSLLVLFSDPEMLFVSSIKSVSS